jgi:sialidase-1
MRRSAALVILAGALAATGLGFRIPGGVVPTPGSDGGTDAGIPELAGHEFTYVCRDGGAGGYEAFPDVCRLADGRLMAVFYAGYDHVSLPTAKWPKGGRIDLVLSSDEGRTWSKPRALFDGPDDDRDPSIVQLPSGKLLCNFFSLRGKPAEAGAAGAWDGLGTWIVDSIDQGRTWSAPRLVSAEYYCSSPIRLLPDGRLMLGLYRQEGEKAWGAVATSHDEGKTWTPIVDIPNGGWKLDAETDVIPLDDGRILAVEREPATSMCVSFSADGGKTWSVSKPLGFPGHCPYLLRTSGGVLVLAHRLPGTSLHYSHDDGRTWSENVVVDDLIGAYPSLVELKDGSVLVVYYEEGPGSNIRARRFRVGPGGLEWLTVPICPL